MMEEVYPQNDLQDIHTEYSEFYRYLRGICLVGVGIWLGMTLFDDINGYWINIFTEGISILATYFIFDEITKRSAKHELKSQLMAELKSPTVAPAVNALDRLRRENWLDNNNFIEKDLQRANWEEAYIGGLNFGRGKLSGIKLRSATTFNGYTHHPVNFQEADLRTANLREVNLHEANLRRANLRQANLDDAKLFSSSLEEADLTGANLARVDLTGANLKEAYLTNANLQSANLADADLQSVDLTGANLEGAYLWVANLAEADMGLANLCESDLTGANLQGVYLQEAKLDLADLRAANLRAADLTEASLTGANLSGVSLEGADLTGANLSNVIWHDTNSYRKTRLPDDTDWTDATDMEKFCNPHHPEYEYTQYVIEAIRKEIKLRVK